MFTLAAPWKPYPQLWAMEFPGQLYLLTVVSSLYTSWRCDIFVNLQLDIAILRAEEVAIDAIYYLF